MKLGVILCSLLALIQVSEAAVQCPDYRTHFKQNRIIGGVSARFLLENISFYIYKIPHLSTPEQFPWLAYIRNYYHGDAESHVHS